MTPEIGRLVLLKTQLAVALPKRLAEQLPWRRGDRVALRVAGEKLIVERLNLEPLARIRTGEAQAEPRTVTGTE